MYNGKRPLLDVAWRRRRLRLRRAGELLDAWGDPAALYAHLRAGGKAPACLSRTAVSRLRRTEPDALAARLEQCAALGVTVLTPADAAYPDRLRALPDRPLALYATGDVACLNGRHYAAVVGTRRPTRYGVEACRAIAGALAGAGAVVVSGLADGLDSEAHRAAVEAHGLTAAFLGTAIDKTFPAANAGLRRDIEESGGVIVSEYPPGYTGRTTGTFLARNRLIAGLAEAVCVAEARLRSGTLNTVSHAERYGRTVLAVPGSIFSPTCEGTNDLLRARRAAALCRAGDALEAVGLDPAAAAPTAVAETAAPLSPDAAAALAALGPVPRTPDEVAAAAGLPIQRALVALAELEFAGPPPCSPATAISHSSKPPGRGAPRPFVQERSSCQN